MAQFAAELTEHLSKRPYLSLLFTIIVVLAAVVYMKNEVRNIVTDGHRFTAVGFVPQTIGGQTVYILVYQDLKQ